MRLGRHGQFSHGQFSHTAAVLHADVISQLSIRRVAGFGKRSPDKASFSVSFSGSHTRGFLKRHLSSSLHSAYQRHHSFIGDLLSALPGAVVKRRKLMLEFGDTRRTKQRATSDPE